MSSFTTPLRVERLNGQRRWRVLEPFVYKIGELDSDSYVLVPARFETDFASIPRGLWNLFPPIGGRYDKAAVVHDYLYQDGFVVALALEVDDQGYVDEHECHLDVTRRQADKIFLEAMQVLGVGWPARWTIYTGVRIGGRCAWKDGHAQNS